MDGRIRRPWFLRTPDERLVREIARRTGLSDTSSRILANRGLTDPSEADRFLSGDLSGLTAPYGMRDLEKASRRLAEAALRREPVFIYADYDVDGATGAAVLFLFLKDLFPDLPVRIHQNHRIVDGYGLKAEHLDPAIRGGCRLVVTVDCGISDLSAIRAASAAGIDVVVTDHHLPGTELPDAFAIVNPKRADCGHPVKELAGVGVVFMLVCGIRKALREMGAFGEGEGPNLLRYLDLVSLGTVADMVPLTGDNRILVRAGLEQMRANPRPGIAALMRLAGVAVETATEADLGFRIAPRLNAAGRMGDSNRSAALLVTTDASEAESLAQELHAENVRRQKEEERILREVEARLGDPEGAIVLADEGWHLGVLGIVASKIVERFNLPVVLLSIDGEEATGSCRSVEGFPIVDALGTLAPILTRFGGHSQAAGISLPAANVPALREGLSREALRHAASGAARASRIEVDALVPLSGVTFDLMKEWERLRPFGMGNREPVLQAADLLVSRTRNFGPDGRHLAFEVEGDGCRFEVSAFNRSESAVRPGATLELLFTPQVSIYRGNRSLRLLLRDLRVQ